MPQLDTYFYPSQLFWLALIFTIFYIVMSSFILPKMSQIFKEREVRISGAIRSAEQAKQEACNIENSYKAKLTHAKKTTSISILDMAAELSKNSKKSIGETEIKLKELLKKSEKEVSEFKIKAKEELENVVIEAANLATKEFIKININEEEVKNLVKSIGKK